MKRDTTSQEFFENKYRDNSDPWNFASSEYEESRYQVEFEAVNHRHYLRAFEPGCSIGMLTIRLAHISDQVEAMDISCTAVKQAHKRCEGLANVAIACGQLPTVMPAGSFDLIVLSEIGYYFEEKQLTEVGQKLVGRLTRHGILLATHWLGVSEDHLLDGDRVHDILGTLQCLVHTHSERHSYFRLDRWERI